MTRIIAGRAKGTQLTAPRCGTRPTSDRVREALFSTLVTWFGTVGEPAEKHLAGVAVLLFDLWALVAVGLALLGTVCVFLPDTTRYFRYFEAHRARLEETYRTPERIFYGRLPRFR